MTKIPSFLVMLFVASLGVSAAANADCSWPDRITLASILPVAGDDGSYASGIVIAQNRVLTAAHAVIDSERAFVRIKGGFQVAQILSIDHQKDLAVLKVNTGDLRPITLSMRDPYKNEPVWAIGFPKARQKTTSAGIFQNKQQGALHTSAPIEAGESGGGLIACDRNGFVLAGMLRGYGAYMRGDTYVRIANHSVSVAASDIQNFVSFNLYR